jgi:hypothetical protein
LIPARRCGKRGAFLDTPRGLVSNARGSEIDDKRPGAVEGVVSTFGFRNLYLWPAAALFLAASPWASGDEPVSRV